MPARWSPSCSAPARLPLPGAAAYPAHHAGRDGSPARSLLLGPTLLKVRFGVDEVVTTLLLNFIVLLFVSMLLDGPLKDPMALGWPQSPKLIADAAAAAAGDQGTRLHFGFVMALAAAVAGLGRA